MHRFQTFQCGRRLIVSTLAVLMGAFGANAAPAVRELEAHVHGVGHIGFVADGASLVAELETPLVNLVGFEHAPANPEERQAYESAIAWLSDAQNVFDLERARCGVGAVTVTAPEFAAEGAAEVGHDPAHDHDDYDDHEGGAHEHADVLVEYGFTCETLPRLRRIAVNLFDRFPGFERIDAVFAGDRTYTGALTPADATLELR